MSLLIHPNLLSDQEILLLLAENNPLAWENLYIKYSPAMYGMISSLTDDKITAIEILKKAFLQLRDGQILSKTSFTICGHLLRFTYGYATRYLKENGIKVKDYHPPAEIKMVHLLYTQSNSLSELALMVNITEGEAKRKIQIEFSSLRNKNIA